MTILTLRRSRGGSGAPGRRGLLVLLTLLLIACGGAPGAPGNDGAGDEGSGDASAAAAATDPACDPDDGGITLPDGFCAAIFAELPAGPRHLVVDAEGDVYVRLRGERRGRGQGAEAPTGGIAALRDTDGDGRADRMERFDDTFGTGIEIHDGHLWYSTTREVYRRPLQDGELVPAGEPELMIGGFPQQGSHADKPFTFDDTGHVYVTVGAPSNACQEESRTPGSAGQDPCPQRELQAGIWRFDAGVPGQTQADGTRYAAGIRNAVAIQWNHEVDALYALQHGRDSLYDLWNDLYTLEQSAELPAEELLKVTEGADFGWPYCYWDQTQGRRVLAPEYGGDGGQEQGRCADRAKPILAFPGHWAPNDLLFVRGDAVPERYRNGALVAFHGSWNRMPFEQEGYDVVFVPFDGDVPASDEWETFAGGFNEEAVMQSRDAEHRPTGLAQAPDGALFIADDQGGVVWRVVPTGS